MLMTIFGEDTIIAAHLLALQKNCLDLAQSCLIDSATFEKIVGHWINIHKNEPYFWAHSSFQKKKNAPVDRCYSKFSRHVEEIDLSL